MNDSQNVVINVSTGALVKILIAGLLLIVLYVIRDIVFMVLIAMILASALDPLVEWLYHRAKFPRGLSVILVYLLLLLLLGLIIYFLTPAIARDFSQLSGRFDEFRDQISMRADAVSSLLDKLGLSSSLVTLGSSFNNLTKNFFQTTLGVVNGLAQLIGVLVFTFYLISSESGMKNFIKSLVPFKHQAYVMNLTDKIEKKIGYWLLGQLILSSAIFIFTFLALLLLGVKYALALSLLAGFFEIIPYLGPILSAVPAILVAFVQSPPLAVFVIIAYIVIQQAENYILVPKIMGKTVGANPLVILLAVLVGFKIMGIIGMLMAVPIVGALGVFLNDFRDGRREA